MPILAAAFWLGVFSGQRSLTPLAVLWLARHRGAAAYALGALALLEFAGDLYPRAPARTRFAGLTARCLTGGLCGAKLAERDRCTVAAATGAAAAIVGSYAGLSVRRSAAAAIGAVPAAIVEDAMTILGAAAVVASL